MKKLVSWLLVAVLLLACVPAMAQEADPFGKYETEIVITSARSMDATVMLDEMDPEKKSYTENRWMNTFKDVLGIDLQYQWVAADGDANTAKWSAAIASGNLPDFAVVNDNIYKMLLESEVVADMTEVYDKYASEAYKAKIDEAMYSQLWHDGALRGIPFPSKGYHGTTVLYIRKDWLDKLGMEAPDTLEEVVEVARAFKAQKLGGEETIGMIMTHNTINGKLDGVMNGLGAYLDYWVEKDGKLAWSNIQPEMRTALEYLQGLYKEGLINQDFAVVSQDVAQEYIASGKCGVMYVTSWVASMALTTLTENDPELELINMLPPSAEGKNYLVQTNTPTAGKVFVNKDCKNPEAVMKMLNLADKYCNELEYSNDYAIGSDGFMWFKFLPYGDMPRPIISDLMTANDVRVAAETGSTDNFELGDSMVNYEGYQKALKGEAAAWYYIAYGPGGSFTMLYDTYKEGRVLPNAFTGLPTETMSLMGDVINDSLQTAMLEVIMGADISVFDKACQDWLANGGQAITDEVNEWYATMK